jgi:hypothetical protein
MDWFVAMPKDSMVKSCSQIKKTVFTNHDGFTKLDLKFLNKLGKFRTSCQKPKRIKNDHLHKMLVISPKQWFNGTKHWFFLFGEFCLLAIYSSSLYNPNLFGIKGFVVDVYNL